MQGTETTVPLVETAVASQSKRNAREHCYTMSINLPDDRVMHILFLLTEEVGRDCKAERQYREIPGWERKSVKNTHIHTHTHTR